MAPFFRHTPCSTQLTLSWLRSFVTLLTPLSSPYHSSVLSSHSLLHSAHLIMAPFFRHTSDSTQLTLSSLRSFAPFFRHTPCSTQHTLSWLRSFVTLLTPLSSPYRRSVLSPQTQKQNKQEGASSVGLPREGEPAGNHGMAMLCFMSKT